MLEMLMITPGTLPTIMRSAASRPQRNTPVRFTSITACHWSRLIFDSTLPSLYLTSSASRVMPALLTSACTAPHFATIWSNRAMTSASFATLAPKQCTVPEFSQAAAATSGHRPQVAERQHRFCGARRFAMAAPKPRAAPVMTMVLPLRFMSRPGVASSRRTSYRVSCAPQDRRLATPPSPVIDQRQRQRRAFRFARWRFDSTPMQGSHTSARR